MLRKIATIKVPKGAGPREVKTKNMFATYDKQSAAFEFFFSDNVDVEDATADVLFIIDGQKVFMEDGAALGGTNETHTFIYPLPDKLLNYTGKVDGYLYLNFADGSQSDEIHFTFSIKKSQIDEEMEDAPDVYIKSFEEIKSDVKSKADQAKKDMQDNVDQVESDYQAWKEQQENNQTTFENDFLDWKTYQEKKQTDFESDTNETIDGINAKVEEVRGKVSEQDISDMNLLTGTSSEWEEFSFNGWTAGFMTYSLEQLGLKVGDTLTYAAELDNTRDESNLSSLSVLVNFYAEKDEVISRIRGNQIKSNEKGMSMGKGEIPEGTTRIQAYKLSKNEGNESKKAAARKHKLQKGNYATYWTPNPSEVVTQDQYDKLVNAITNLGGSI